MNDKYSGLKKFLAAICSTVILLSALMPVCVLNIWAGSAPDIIIVNEEAGESLEISSVSDEQVKIGEKSFKCVTSDGKDFWLMRGNLPNALDITPVSPTGTEGAVRFWIYVENRSDVLFNWSGSQMQLGAGWDSNVFVWSNWDTQIRNSGWNEVILPFESAGKIGTPDLKKLTYMNIRTGNAAFRTVAYIDNIRVSVDTSAPEHLIDPSIIFSDEDGENAGFCAALSNERAKFGDFSYKVQTGVGNHEYWMIRNGLARTLDITSLTNEGTDGYLKFWIYIEDISVVPDMVIPGTTTQVQLGAGWDNNVYIWDGWHTQIKVNGWNEITLPFSSAGKNGNPNNSAITYMLIRTGNVSANITAYIDNIHIEAEKEPVYRDPEVILSEEHFESGGFCAEISDEKVKSGNYSYKATPGIVGVTDHWMIRTSLSKPVDITNYKTGSIKFWIYVDSRADVMKNWNGSQLQLGENWDVNVYIWNNWDSQIKSDGWNEIILPFSEAGINGKPDDSSIKYINIRNNNPAFQTTVYIDDIRFSKLTENENIPVRDPELLFSDEDGEAAGFAATITDEKSKFGNYSYKTTPGYSDHEFWMIRSGLPQKTNITDYKNGSVKFWVYVDSRADVMKNWRGSQLQLGENWDVNAYIWNNWDSQIKNDGWNEIILPFSKAGIIGKPDDTAISFMCIRTGNTEFKTVVYFDDIRLSRLSENTNASVIDPAIVLSDEDGENPGFAASITDEKSKVGHYSYKATPGYADHEHWIIRTGLARQLNIAELTDNATAGSLSFWIYIDDVSDVRANWKGSQAQLGKDWDSDVFVWSNWDSQITRNGWNKIILNFSSAGKYGNPDIKNLTYINIRTNNPLHKTTVFIDDIRISNELLTGDWSTTAEGAKMFQPFETLSGISTDAIKSIWFDGSDKKQGNSSLAFITDSGQFHMTYTPENPVDASEYNCLEFDLYVSNPDFFSFGSNSLELTSSGTMDSKEMSWSFSELELEEGWNHIMFSFERASFTLDWKFDRDIDLKAINYMRIYAIGAELYNGKDVQFKIDNMQFTKNGLPPEDEKTYITNNSTGIDVYLTAEDGVIPDYGTFTVNFAEDETMPESIKKALKEDKNTLSLKLDFIHDDMGLLIDGNVKVNVDAADRFKNTEDLNVYKIDINNNITSLSAIKRGDEIVFDENRKLSTYVITSYKLDVSEANSAVTAGISVFVISGAVIIAVLVIAVTVSIILIKRKRVRKVG